MHARVRENIVSWQLSRKCFAAGDRFWKFEGENRAQERNRLLTYVKTHVDISNQFGGAYDTGLGHDQASI